MAEGDGQFLTSQQSLDVVDKIEIVDSQDTFNFGGWPDYRKIDNLDLDSAEINEVKGYRLSLSTGFIIFYEGTGTLNLIDQSLCSELI